MGRGEMRRTGDNGEMLARDERRGVCGGKEGGEREESRRYEMGGVD